MNAHTVQSLIQFLLTNLRTEVNFDLIAWLIFSRMVSSRTLKTNLVTEIACHHPIAMGHQFDKPSLFFDIFMPKNSGEGDNLISQNYGFEKNEKK